VKDRLAPVKTVVSLEDVDGWDPLFAPSR
jgi:hypothetical protein